MEVVGRQEKGETRGSGAAEVVIKEPPVEDLYILFRGMMETIRKHLLEFVSERGFAVVTSVLCVTAGWAALTYWVRRFGVADKNRRVSAVATTSGAAVDGAGADHYDRRTASRTSLTPGERRVAREAAGELFAALSRYRDARERDGSGVGHPGRMAGRSLQNGDVHLLERVTQVYDREDGDYAR